MNIKRANVESYLSKYWGQNTQLLSMEILDGRSVMSGEDESNTLALFAQGHPMLVKYLAQEEHWEIVLQASRTTQHGIDGQPDADHFLLDHDTHDDLPQHTPALDVGVITAEHGMVSLADENDFFVVTQHLAGQPYSIDLQRLHDTGEQTRLDVQRAEQLAIYLAEIHGVKHDNPLLYQRHIRDLIGGDEGIMDLADSYPDDLEFATPIMLKRLEQNCISWGWKLKEHPERLSAIHGDFQPANIIFQDTINFRVLGRGHNRWGEPADDVACIAINYLFYSLLHSGSLQDPFKELWQTFWDVYDIYSRDDEILTTIGPFLAQRALAFASPAWYSIPDNVRLSLLHFAKNVLAKPLFDPAQVNQYIQPPKTATVVEAKPPPEVKLGTIGTIEYSTDRSIAGAHMMKNEDGWTPIWAGSHTLG